MDVARLVLRQETGTTVPEEEPAVSCNNTNDYDGRLGIRISAIFVILVGSTLGKLFPSSRSPTYNFSSTRTNNRRRPLPHVRQAQPLNVHLAMGLLQREVLRLRRDHRHRLHSPSRACERRSPR